MKRSVFAVAALLLLSPAYAEMKDHDKHGPSAEKMEEHMKSRLDRLDKSLNLTDEQRSKIDAAMTKRMERRKALREEMKKLHEESEAEIRAVLTDDQKKIYDEKRAERKEQRKEKRHKKGDRKKK